ncbi:aminotransferase class V-fold PLP-dependent enzyme [Microbacterium deminutum]|uniref:Cysteine desulfurase n=1 Tax=Microbacterium deminutum TaxID=344164 RepID=A0ABN2R809_9MICO
MDETPTLDVERVRASFDFVGRGRIATNNAASTQLPRELLQLYAELVPQYENVHRGQSDASALTTARFEASYDTIAQWICAPNRRTISIHRKTTEAINLVMYTLLTEFRDGDNVVTTMMEHNSDYVPWYALCREILPRFGRTVECRIARFDHESGELDLGHLASLVDDRTKLVCCTGASNFLGTKPPLADIRRIADGSGYRQPNGEICSRLLVDAAQLMPSALIDVRAMDVDYLAFSFHKFIAPLGVGVLYAKEHLREDSLPFLYGGDMIAEGMVTPDHVGYNVLPWKYSAGTPNILGVIVSAQAMRLAIDLVGADPSKTWFRSADPIPRRIVGSTMSRIGDYTASLTRRAVSSLTRVPGLRIHGVPAGVARAPLVAFTVDGHDPFEIARALNDRGVESRAGCHCATLAHHDLGLDPPASCRISFSFYNTAEDVDRAVEAVGQAVSVPVR